MTSTIAPSPEVTRLPARDRAVRDRLFEQPGEVAGQDLFARVAGRDQLERLTQAPAHPRAIGRLQGLRPRALPGETGVQDHQHVPQASAAVQYEPGEPPSFQDQRVAFLGAAGPEPERSIPSSMSACPV